MLYVMTFLMLDLQLQHAEVGGGIQLQLSAETV